MADYRISIMLTSVKAQLRFFNLYDVLILLKAKKSFTWKGGMIHFHGNLRPGTKVSLTNTVHYVLVFPYGGPL
jgi:hypothetical protein